MSWVLRRLREASTWRGIVWLLTVAGLSLRPDQAEAIVTAGMALAGLLGVFLADANPPPQLPPIELVGQSAVAPLADQGRVVASDAGLGVGAVQPADLVRQSVPAEYRPRPAATADPNTYPNLRPGGWGDRD